MQEIQTGKREGGNFKNYSPTPHRVVPCNQSLVLATNITEVKAISNAWK
jgi:hypothetical protein